MTPLFSCNSQLWMLSWSWTLKPFFANEIRSSPIYLELSLGIWTPRFKSFECLKVFDTLSSTLWYSSFFHLLPFSLCLSSIQWKFNHFMEIGRASTEGRKAQALRPITLSQSLLHSPVFKLLPGETQNASSYLLRQKWDLKWNLPTGWMPLDQTEGINTMLKECLWHCILQVRYASKHEIMTHLKCKSWWTLQWCQGWKHSGLVEDQDLKYTGKSLTLET